MRLEYLIPIGILKKTKKFLPGHLEFKKVIGDVLKGLNVPFQDVCCDPLNNSAPVRFNPTSGDLEYYDNVSDSWVFADETARIVAAAINSTATATAAQLAGGLITSTSAAAVTLTLPTATAFGTQIKAVRGTRFAFFVDNSAGANIVTVAVNTGITVITAVITGSNTLTVAAGAVGMFRLYFTSATTAVLSRVQ
jgi:hypothetical protein